MKQVTVEVKENKYKFFLELLKSLDFVQVSSTSELSEREQLLQDVVRGMQEAKLAAKGKVKSPPAKNFLNEL